MAKVMGLREQRVQFFYDTDFRVTGVVTTGADLVAAEKVLFAAATPGDLSRTNMTAPGQLTSDQTFLTFAVRHECNFFPVNNTSGNSGTLFTTAEHIIWTLQSSTFQFQVSAKVEFEGPLTMTPAGGGPWGFVSDSANPLIVNGEPSSPSIYVMPLPIAITKRQGIQMIEKKFNLPNPAAAAINIVTAINAYPGGRILRAYIDGYNTRDVL